jgi:PPE-repeat protein
MTATPAQAAAYETEFADRTATVIAANRVMPASLVDTNVLGHNGSGDRGRDGRHHSQ